MTDLMKEDEGVYETLRRLPAKFWSRHAFDNSCKTDHCTNTMTESFNAWLGVQRKVPLLSMLEWIRKKLMKRMVNRRKKAEAWESDIPKKIYDKMMKNLQIGSPNLVARASEWLYEVDHIHKTHIVDLEHHVCDCGHWQVSGIPCIHAMPCILHSKKELGQFISPLLNRGSYLRTYTGIIHPIPDKSSWPITTGDEIFPPMMKRPSGRPKVNRRREADEVPAEKRRYRMQCKYCKEFGHNKRGCPINPLNANKSTRHYKSNLKGYMTRIWSATRGLQGRTNSIFDSAPDNGSTISHMQAHEQVRVTVEVHEPQEAQMPPAKKNKIGNHEGPLGTKKIISRLPANVQPDAPWLGVQGKKIMATGGITLREKHNGPKRSELKNVDKGNGPSFPPYM